MPSPLTFDEASSHVDTFYCPHVFLLSLSSNGRLAVLGEQIIDRFSQQRLRRAVALQAQMFELLRNGWIEMSRDGLLADSAWHTRSDGRDGSTCLVCSLRRRRL